MGTLVNKRDLHWLEDLLAAANVFVFCRDTESDLIQFNYRTDESELVGNPSITAVVSSWEDAGLMQQVFRQNRDAIIDKFGSEVTIVHQFWSYFLSYLEMARISSDLPGKFFLSTVVENSEVNLAELRIDFNLQITMIKSAASYLEQESMKEQIAVHLQQLNARMRHLKICNVSLGYSESKFIIVGQSPIQYGVLQI